MFIRSKSKLSFIYCRRTKKTYRYAYPSFLLMEPNEIEYSFRRDIDLYTERMKT